MYKNKKKEYYILKLRSETVMSDLYEELGMNVHKAGSTTEQYLQETANWEVEIEKAINEPAFTMPKGLTREQRREWVKKCANGEIEADA